MMRRAATMALGVPSRSMLALTAASRSFHSSSIRRAIAVDEAELKKEQELIDKYKKMFPKYFEIFNATEYASCATQQGSSSSSANAGNTDKSTNASGSSSGSSSGGGDGSFNFTTGPAASANVPPGAVAINVPQLLTGLLLIYLGYKLILKRREDTARPTLPTWCTGIDAQSKYFLYILSVDQAQRQAYQGEFDMMRRGQPFMYFFDWLDQRLPMWGTGTHTSRFEALASIRQVLEKNDKTALYSMGNSINSLSSVTDPMSRVDQFVAQNSTVPPAPGFGAPSSMMGYSNGSQTPPVMPPPMMVQQPPQGMPQQQMMRTPPTQDLGGAPVPGMGLAVAPSGNPAGSTVSFNEALGQAPQTPPVAGSVFDGQPPQMAQQGQPIQPVHGTDPFAQPPQMSQEPRTSM